MAGRFARESSLRVAARSRCERSFTKSRLVRSTTHARDLGERRRMPSLFRATSSGSRAADSLSCGAFVFGRAAGNTRRSRHNQTADDRRSRAALEAGRAIPRSCRTIFRRRSDQETWRGSRLFFGRADAGRFSGGSAHVADRPVERGGANEARVSHSSADGHEAGAADELGRGASGDRDRTAKRKAARSRPKVDCRSCAGRRVRPQISSALRRRSIKFNLRMRRSRRFMSRRLNKNVGIIGLGIIGSRVREALRAKGFRTFVWNRTPKPVPTFVGAPVELAEMCDIIQIFVSDDDALLDVVKQLAPGIGARHVIVAQPAVAPHTMVSASEIVQRRGARFVEAPFTGSKEAAENGQLVYYIGGEESAIEEARPVLEASSKAVMAIGEIGTATLMKIATNMVTAASVQAAAEAMALVRATGLSIEKFVEAMKGNASNSKTLDLKLPKMVSADFEPHFSVKHMLKDMQIASRLGLSHHLELGVTSAARDRLL